MLHCATGKRKPFKLTVILMTVMEGVSIRAMTGSVLACQVVERTVQTVVVAHGSCHDRASMGAAGAGPVQLVWPEAGQPPHLCACPQ